MLPNSGFVAIIEGQDDTFFKKRFESVNNKHVDAVVKSSVEALTENLESTKSRGSNIIAQSSTIVYRKSTNLKD